MAPIKPIIPKKHRIIKVDYPKNPGCEVPVIYIRYKKDIIIYIGETVDYYKGRPLRPKCRDLNCSLEDLDNNKFPGIQGEKKEWWRHQIKWDNTDTVRILNAPKNGTQRKKWEAKLVCWLNPKLQKIEKYIGAANLDMKSKKNIALLTRVNSDKIIKKANTCSESILEEVNYYKKCKRKSSKTLTSWEKKEVKREIDRCLRRASYELRKMYTYQTTYITSKNLCQKGSKQWFNKTYEKMYTEVRNINENERDET
jgi:hypothetical protein|tara:strand:- start:75 stop:836 length:762 start_codon:yes stop_codon:yes gene_type:complete